MRKFSIAAASLLAAAGAAFGQDSVPATAGANDALSAYDAAAQRVRYVVDGVSQSTSWGQAVLVAPVIKASRDADPLYKTQILGSAAVSPSLLQNVSFPSENYGLWTTAGQGVNPSFNSPPGANIAMTGFATQFAVASSDFSLSPSNLVGATIGRAPGNMSRLYVERVVAAISRPSSGAADTATLSLGSVDAAGHVMLRADNFNTLTTTAGRVLGDNIARVSLDTRNSTLNNLFASGSANSSADPSATTYVVSNESTPTNVPASVLQAGVGPFGLVFDFSNRLRTGSTTANLTNLAAAHLASGAASHRGNPSFAPLTPLGGNAGTLATLAIPTSGTRVNALNACGLNFGSAGSPPTVASGSARAFTLAAPISSPLGFTTNTTGGSSFRQYLSQVPFRGGTGLVGVGQNGAGQLVLAATANDPMNGDYIAAVTATGPTTSAWTVAAFPGQAVLSGPGGSSVGSLTIPVTISAPAVDRLGNVYFVATWTPTASPATTGLFKAVNTASGYQLERILSVGQTITGANSTRPYTITALSLSDSDSLASGAFHHQHLIAEQSPDAPTTDAANIRAKGGLIVNSVITYNNNGVNEAYDAVLFVSPTPGQTFCPADFNQSGAVTVQDIFDYLAAYFSGGPGADFNQSGAITVQDIFDFLAAYFTAC